MRNISGLRTESAFTKLLELNFLLLTLKTFILSLLLYGGYFQNRFFKLYVLSRKRPQLISFQIMNLLKFKL